MKLQRLPPDFHKRKLSVEEIKKYLLSSAKQLLEKIAEAYDRNEAPGKIQALIDQVNTLNYKPPTTPRWLLGLYGIYKKGKFLYVEANDPTWSVPRTAYNYASSKWSVEVIQRAMYFLLSLTLYNMFYEYDEQTPLDTYNLALEQTFDPIWKELTTVREFVGSDETTEFAIQQMTGALQKFGILDEFNRVKRIQSSDYVSTYIAASRYINRYLVFSQFEAAEEIYQKWLNKPKPVQFDWAKLLSQPYVKYDQLHATFQGLPVVYTYLPLREYDEAEFVVPLNRLGNVVDKFRVAWGRSVFEQAPLTPDELQKQAREILKFHTAPFPYDMIPMLHLQDVETWSPLKDHALNILEYDWNPKDSQYERFEGEADLMFWRLRNLLADLQDFLMYGEVAPAKVLRHHRGLSKYQWQALEPFLVAVNLKSDILNIHWRGLEAATTLQKPEQKYMYHALYAFISLVNELVTKDNLEAWQDSANQKIAILSDREGLIARYTQEMQEPTDNSWFGKFSKWAKGGFSQWTNKPEEIESQRLVLSENLLNRFALPLRILNKILDEGKLDKFAVKRINTQLFANLGLLFKEAEPMNAYQRKTLERAQELSGQKGITQWMLYDQSDPPKFLKEDIMYLRAVHELDEVPPVLAEDVAKGWILFVEILVNLFDEPARFNRAEIERKLKELEGLELVFGKNYKLLKGTHRMELTDVPTQIGAPIPLVTEDHVDWDYSASPTIIEPILDRVQNLSPAQRQRLTDYVTLDQMVAIGMIRPDIGFVTGITHSTHPSLTKKYIVGHQNPLTGYYDFRLTLDDELRLLNKWQVVSKLLEQLEKGEPADPVLQKQLNEGR